MKSVGSEFADSLWSFLFQAVDGYMVGDDSVVTCGLYYSVGWILFVGVFWWCRG